MESVYEERVDVLGSLLRLVESQSDELIALRAENLRLTTMGLLNLAELVGKRAATGYGQATCKDCGNAFVKHSPRTRVCRDCYRQTKARCMKAARLRSPLTARETQAA